MTSFSESQQKAIEHPDGPALILAGPGSGKTTVITHRVKYLMDSLNISGGNILVITFSRAAAGEMKERFLRLSDGNLNGVTFGTFHSVFFRILRYAYRYDASNILTEKEQYAILREITDRFSLEYEDEQEFLSGLLDEISSVKSNDLSLDHYYSKVCPEEIFRKLFRLYEKKLADLRKVDFDDILLMTLKLLSEREDIRKLWHEKYRYILIDEFQDINYVQYQVVRLLAAPENNLFIVGDDDQSIYRFRGARPEIMLGFEKDYPNARKILLDINFRSDACVVRCALRLIAHNKTRFPKDIRAIRPAVHPVSLHACKDIGEQNRFLTEEIISHHAAGMPYKDMAILYRTNIGGRFLTYALLKENIPFLIRDTLPNLFDHWIAQDVLSYLLLASGKRNRQLWLRIINRPNRYVGRDAFPPLKDPDFSDLYSAFSSKEWMYDRIERLEYDLKMMHLMAPYAAIHYLRKAVGYDKYLASYAEDHRISLPELTEVLDSVQESAKKCRTLSQWQDQIQEYTEALKKQSEHAQENAGDCVCLCTLHGAKGLEFPVVFIPDVNEENIPHSRAALDADLEEERRLFYVGITRAKDELFLSCLRERLNQQKSPSRFLSEMKPPKSSAAPSRAH